MKKLINIAFLGLSLSLVSCGHFGQKSCCKDGKQCSMEKSANGDSCCSGQCDVKKKKKKS